MSQGILRRAFYATSLTALVLFSGIGVAATSAAAATPASTSTPNTNTASSTPVLTPTVSTATAQPTVVPQAPNLSSRGYVLMDANTGMIIAHKNMHTVMQPASLTKLMTLYLTFQALKNGQIHLTDPVRISKTAWATGGSRMFVTPGSEVTVQKLIQGIIVASGNDACTALAQYVGGNQATFVSMMNAQAKALGMKSTHYMDPTGLPKPGHHVTPYDIALLTRAIINNFPQYYHFFDQKWIDYDHIKQPNRNRLLWRDPTVDGLKTGHTQEAGYCLVSSAKRHGMRLISVMMGGPTDASRNDDSESLLNWGFRFYKTHKLYDANQVLARSNVWLGENRTVPVGLASPLYVTIQTGTYASLKPEININKKLQAPIQKNQQVGVLNIHLNGKIITSAPLIALKADTKGGVLKRTFDHVTGIL